MNTATVSALPPAAVRYLRRATWGLQGARGQELWDELEDHLLTRADQLCAFGTPYPEALARALRELGPPSRVSAGMTEVYLMPKMIRAGLMIGIAGLLTALAFGGQQAVQMLPALSRPPITPSCARWTNMGQPAVKTAGAQNGMTCPELKFPNVYAGAFVSLQDLQRALTTLNLKVERLPSGGLSVQYPGGVKRIIDRVFSQGGQDYAAADSLIISTVGQPITSTLSVRGYDNPVINFGEFALQVGNKAAPASGRDFYAMLAPTLVGLLTTPKLADGWAGSVYVSDEAQLNQHVVRVKQQAGEVVMLLSKVRTPAGSELSYHADFAPVGPGGSVTLRDPHRQLRFVPTLGQLSPDPTGGRVNAVMVRVTGTSLRALRSGIVQPLSPTSDAAR